MPERLLLGARHEAQGRADGIGHLYGHRAGSLNDPTRKDHD
jgi:hypothetical protein